MRGFETSEWNLCHTGFRVLEFNHRQRLSFSAIISPLPLSESLYLVSFHLRIAYFMKLVVPSHYCRSMNTSGDPCYIRRKPSMFRNFTNFNNKRILTLIYSEIRRVKIRCKLPWRWSDFRWTPRAPSSRQCTVWFPISRTSLQLERDRKNSHPSHVIRLFHVKLSFRNTAKIEFLKCLSISSDYLFHTNLVAKLQGRWSSGHLSDWINYSRSLGDFLKLYISKFAINAPILYFSSLSETWNSR